MGDRHDEIPDHPLPPPLLRGPQLFNAWSQKRLLNVEQRAATPSSPLYHHTGEAALRGILQHQRPWCFSHKHQSDPNEFEYALRLARQQLQQGMNRQDYFERSLCGCLEDALRLKGLASPFDFYLFSKRRAGNSANGSAQSVGRISRRRNPPTAVPEQQSGGLRFANPPYALSRCASRLGGDGLCPHLTPNWPAAQLVNRKSTPARIGWTSCLTLFVSGASPAVVTVLFPKPR